MRLIEKAVAKAVELHHGQTRKGDGRTPYIVHPLDVAFIVSKYVTEEAVIVAAILHDTLEDCDYSRDDIEEEFGRRVTEVVYALSEDKNDPDVVSRKGNNLIRLRNTLTVDTMAYFVKAADALSNMRSLVESLRSEGAAVWQRFALSKENMIEYYRIILHDTRHFLPPELVEEFAGLLKDLEYSEAYSHRPIGFVEASGV